MKEQVGGALLYRCGHSEIAGGKITCDEHEADHVEFDPNVKIKKFYYFLGQFNVQIFSNLSFVEDNGRGDIAFGQCLVVSP